MYQNTQTGNAQHQNVLFIIDIYNTYASILMTEKGLNQINLRCDICSVLPYTIFSDLEMIAKNMHSDDMEKTQKLEIEAVIADYYLEAVGSCEQWDECPSGVDWLELIKSVQLLRKYLEKKIVRNFKLV